MLQITELVHVNGNTMRALDGITLTLPPGTPGLLGPNEAGKSTLMRTIATLKMPHIGPDPFQQRRADPRPATAAPGAGLPAAGFRRLPGHAPQAGPFRRAAVQLRHRPCAEMDPYNTMINRNSDKKLIAVSG